MSRFGYPTHQQPSRVTFGTGAVRMLADSLDAGTVVFATGHPEVLAQIDASLIKRGARLDRARVIIKPAGEPSRDMVEAGASFLTKALNTRIVGIGGGSVLDWCRLSIASASGALELATGQLTSPGLLVGRPELWLIPTTCATGAEAAAVAVYSDAGRKVPVVSPAFVADHVILDGQFLTTVAPGALAAFLGDALTHAVEAYVSIVPGTFAKEAAVSAARLILANAQAQPGSSRNERLMEAGYLGGVAASNCSVGAVHAFSHSVAAYGVSHGFANAVALEAGMHANADVPALQELADRLGSPSVAGLRSSIAAILELADGGAATSRLRAALTSSAPRADILERMAADVCMRTNPASLSAADLGEFMDDVLLRLNQSREGAQPSHCTPGGGK